MLTIQCRVLVMYLHPDFDNFDGSYLTSFLWFSWPPDLTCSCIIILPSIAVMLAWYLASLFIWSFLFCSVRYHTRNLVIRICFMYFKRPLLGITAYCSSKWRWLEHFEKSTKWVYNLQKQNNVSDVSTQSSLWLNM